MNGSQDRKRSGYVQNAKVPTGTKKRNKGWDNVKQPPLEERFWASVDREGNMGGCWMWRGAKTSYGYGKMRDHYKHVGTHRVSYMLNIGPIPIGMHVLHKCDNPACVNPSHLFLGTQSDNMKDMFKKKRNRNQYCYNKDFCNGRERGVEALIDSSWVQFRSIEKASKATGVNASKISMASRNLRNTAGGMKWRTIKT